VWLTGCPGETAFGYLLMSQHHELSLALLSGRFALRKLLNGDPLPQPAEVVFLSCAGSDRTAVTREEALPVDAQAARGYRCLRLEGEFALEASGILSRICSPLGEAGIPILVYSSFTTDYILLREHDLEAARVALRAQGIHVVPGSELSPEVDR